MSQNPQNHSSSVSFVQIGENGNPAGCEFWRIFLGGVEVNILLGAKDSIDGVGSE